MLQLLTIQYNNLPVHLKIINNIRKFRKELKNYETYLLPTEISLILMTHRFYPDSFLPMISIS